MKFKLKLLISLLIFILFVSLTSIGVGAEGLTIEGDIISRLEIRLEEGQIPLLINNLELDLEYYSPRSGLAKAIVEVSDQESDKINLKEIYTELYLSKTDLKIGKQEITWGKTDGINPTNNFNPEDLTRPFRDDNNISVPAVRAKHYYQDWVFDFVWAPEFTAPNFGDSDDRWSSLLPKAPLMLEDRVENSEFGLRASRWRSQIDFSVSYFRGYSKEPYVSNKGNFKFYQANVFGGDFARDFGSFVMRGEGAYFQPTEDLKNKDPYYKIVLGVDKDLIDELYVNTQYYQEQEEGKDAEQKIILSTEYDITDFKKLKLSTIYNLIDEDYIINPVYSADIRDNVSLVVGGFIFTGDKDTEFGRFDTKDFGYIELQRSF